MERTDLQTDNFTKTHAQEGRLPAVKTTREIQVEKLSICIKVRFCGPKDGHVTFKCELSEKLTGRPKGQPRNVLSNERYWCRKGLLTQLHMTH